MVAIVQIAAGLYYGLGSILLLKKLSGSEEYDVVTPTSGARPKTEHTGGGQGILAFQAGLHTVQRIPDSGWTGTDRQAYTVKIPWEVHLRRKIPAENLYNPEDPYWTTWAEKRAEKLLEKWGNEADAKLEERGVSRQDLVAKLKPDLPLPKTVEFELQGQWWDTNFGNKGVDDMTIRFIGRENFQEVTLADMRAQNEGTSGQVELEVDGSSTTLPESARPTYFDVVYNPYFGVSSDWVLWYKAPLTLVPVRTDPYQFRRWFDYEDPDSVNLILTEDPTQEQELNLDWW